MKTLFSILGKILIGLLVLIVILIAFRNPIAKAGAQIGAKVVAGLPLSVEKIDISLTQSYLLIKELRLGSPSGFPSEETLYLPEFYVNYKFGELLKSKIHLEEVRVHLEHFTVVKNTDGKDSLQAITEKTQPKTGEAPKEEPKKEAPSDEKKPAKKAPELKIDKLSFKFGKVILKDFSKNIEKPSVKEIKLNLNKNYEKLDNPYFILGTLTLEILAKSGLAGLTNIDLGFVKGFADDTIKTSLQFAGQATEQAEKLLKDASGQIGDLTGDAGEVAKKATSTLTDTASSLTDGFKDKLKLPFGKEE